MIPSKPTPEERELGGRLVRNTWIKWAKEQGSEILGAHPSWLLPWEVMHEEDKEVDRLIWEACQTAPEEPIKCDRLHPETLDLVIRFAQAMADKLMSAQEKYGYSGAWTEDDWKEDCQSELLRHIAKGDPRDVANYCAFLWHHGWPTAAPTVDDIQRVLDEHRPEATKRDFSKWEPFRNAVFAHLGDSGVQDLDQLIRNAEDAVVLLRNTEDRLRTVLDEQDFAQPAQPETGKPEASDPTPGEPSPCVYCGYLFCPTCPNCRAHLPSVQPSESEEAGVIALLQEALPFIEMLADYERGESDGACAPNRAKALREMIQNRIASPTLPAPASETAEGEWTGFEPTLNRAWECIETGLSYEEGVHGGKDVLRRAMQSSYNASTAALQRKVEELKEKLKLEKSSSREALDMGARSEEELRQRLTTAEAELTNIDSQKPLKQQ